MLFLMFILTSLCILYLGICFATYEKVFPDKKINFKFLIIPFTIFNFYLKVSPFKFKFLIKFILRYPIFVGIYMEIKDHNINFDNQEFKNIISNIQ